MPARRRTELAYPAQLRAEENRGFIGQLPRFWGRCSARLQSRRGLGSGSYFLPRSWQLTFASDFAEFARDFSARIAADWPIALLPFVHIFQFAQFPMPLSLDEAYLDVTENLKASSRRRRSPKKSGQRCGTQGKIACGRLIVRGKNGSPTPRMPVPYAMICAAGARVMPKSSTSKLPRTAVSLARCQVLCFRPRPNFDHFLN
jgi:hypothetical protein